MRITKVIGIAVVLGLVVAAPAAGLTTTTTRASNGLDGSGGNANSFDAAPSGDGRVVAYSSAATNLVAGDTNGSSDIFVFERSTGMATRVSVTSSGEQAVGSSDDPAVSADGRYVAFRSTAKNLVAGNPIFVNDIFVHDRSTGETSHVSVASDGTPGNAESLRPAISAEGRYVAFYSYASNLVPGDTNNRYDVFVHDRLTRETTRVSVATDGTQSNESSWWPSISADGRFVTFNSMAPNLVSGDTNGEGDVFLHDRSTGETSLVSHAQDGGPANGFSDYSAVTSGGRYVAFESSASNIVAGDSNGADDIFLLDRQTGETARVSASSAGDGGNANSYLPSLSGDGRYVGFYSMSSNLVPGDTNGWPECFIRDVVTGRTYQPVVGLNGVPANGAISDCAIASGAPVVAVGSWASNLTAGDTNGRLDVFMVRARR